MCAWFGEASSYKMQNTFIYTSQNPKGARFGNVYITKP